METSGNLNRMLALFGLTILSLASAFTPPAARAGDTTHIKGQAVLTEASGWFDLDSGRSLGQSGGGVGGDIVFLPKSTWLGPGINVMFSTWNNTPYERTDCERNATISKMGIDLSKMPGGSWLCYRTGERRFGQVRLSTVPVIGDPVGHLKVEFTTWGQ